MNKVAVAQELLKVAKSLVAFSPNFSNAAEFTEYLRFTLIPDLRSSGHRETAADFAQAVRIIDTKRHPGSFSSYLKGLSGDLRDSGYEATADDIDEAIYWMTAGRAANFKPMTASVRKLKCLEGGRVEVTVGEAHSADAKAGDEFTVERENSYRYFGNLDIRGSAFRHDPGLSGKKTRPGTFGPSGIEFAVLKENVGAAADGRGFWATWEVVS